VTVLSYRALGEWRDKIKLLKNYNSLIRRRMKICFYKKIVETQYFLEHVMHMMINIKIFIKKD